MKKIIDFSIKNKLAIWLFTIAIVCSGLYVGTNMKMESMPNINIPVVSVVTAYPGADPNTVDEEVTKDIVQKLMTLPGVDEVKSSSSANVSLVIATYDYDKNLDDAVSEAKEEIEKIDLPEKVQKSNIAKINMNDMPIYTASVSHDTKDIAALTETVNNTVLPAIEGVDGVSSVSIAGQQYEQVELTFDEDELAKYKLDQDTVTKLISATNVDMPLGMYVLDNKEVSVAVDGNVTSVKEFMNINIANAVKPDLKLKDVATYVVKENKDSISRTNGKNSISISVVKGQDANTVQVVNKINDAVEKLKKDDKKLNVEVTSEQGSAIEKSVFTMLEKAVFGALFAVIVIFIFLRSFKTTIISIISIPLSLVIAILCINALDITLNVMTLGAMTVAIGRVIDDSIVVIENIFRRMGLNEGLSKRQLIISSTKEVFVPIASSTIVTIAVFLPIGFVNGPIGEMFLPFGLTMVFALLASLLVAVTIVPMLAHTMFKMNNPKDTESENNGEETHEHKQGKLTKFYLKLLEKCLNHKVISSFIALLMLGGSLALAPVVGFSFMPSEQAETLTMTYTTAVGETKDDSYDQAVKAEKYLMKLDEVKTVEFSIGATSFMTLGTTSNNASFNVIFKEDAKNLDKVVKKIEKHLAKSNAKGEWTVGFASTSAMSSDGISLNIYGDNIEDIRDASDKLTAELIKHKNLSDIETSLSTPYDEYRFVVKKDEAMLYGLTPAQVGMAISQFSTNTAISTVKIEGEKVDIFVAEDDKKEFNSLKDIMNYELETPVGKTVKFKEVITLVKGEAIDTVSRNSNNLYVTFSATTDAKDVSKVTKDIEKATEKIDIAEGVHFDFGGVSEQMTNAFKQIGLAIVAAIVIVYIVLVLTFGNGKAPFAILFSLPFVVIGGIVGLYVTGLTISATALVGVLMLVGIVVTNAIVLVHRVTHKQDEGLPVREALLEAASTRLRPILMTAIATVFALLPLAISGDNSSLISQDLAVTVIGGLISSTLLTLIFVPVVYEIVGKKRKKIED